MRVPHDSIGSVVQLIEGEQVPILEEHCGTCGGEVYCSSKEVGPEDMFVDEFVLVCVNCGLIDYATFEGRDPTSGYQSFCPHCGQLGTEHDPPPA